jgi:hypothetical protein
VEGFVAPDRRAGVALAIKLLAEQRLGAAAEASLYARWHQRFSM